MTRNSIRTNSAIAILLAAALAAGSAAAQSPRLAAGLPSPPALSVSSFVLMEQETATILASLEPELRVEPASITKIMSAYAVFEALAAGETSLDEESVISEKAWRMQGSRTFLDLNSRVSVENLLLGMVVQSGNDASVALAEHLSGAEEDFATLMNSIAQRLGMTGTNFENSTGWPGENHYTTALDTAILTRAMVRDYPTLYGMHALREFTWNGIRQPNRNTLLARDATVDGVKTGHTESAGYCLVASAVRDGMRLIAVVMGAASESQRARDALRLLSYGFRYFETRKLLEAGANFGSARVWKGEDTVVGLTVEDDVIMTLPKRASEGIKTRVVVNEPLIAPLEPGQPVGRVALIRDGETLAELPLVPERAVASGGLWQRTRDSVLLWFE
ncbi:MAG: D-alanyl-D-alanine carboxypeptidase [Gammaproteobacteria bacterium]|nr:D-alanyl-D-alanine carboxypeptidase [Gammaproteobacteria bacterium]MCY3941935.1 D-alanyl-D-alanine carboxypeptidase [Gammaproteobacteria bacterium]